MTWIPTQVNIPKAKHQVCRGCKCKLYAYQSKVLGLCRVCSVKTQDGKPGAKP